MAGDDDIAAQLPEPPPPAPLRRQATIDEAMRRFDAAHGAEPAVDPPSAPGASDPWWTRVGRPQAAALVTAGLVALLGVPAAWLAVSQRSVPLSQPQLASIDDHAADRASPPASSIASVAASSSEARPAAGPASPAKAEQASAASTTLLAKEEAGARDTRAVPQAVAVSAPPAEPVFAESEPPAALPMGTMHAKQARADKPVRLAEAAPRAQPAPAVAPASLAPPPPPPAPPAMVASADTAGSAYSNLAAARSAAKASEPKDMIVSAQRRAESRETVATGNIMVTARRRSERESAGRGDWNACTINDPARDLQKCRGLVNPGSAGPTGRAAAHVADGLRRAWDGDLDGAINEFDKAIATAPRYAVAYLNRGLSLQRKGEFSRAGADLDRAVRYAPGAARAYYNRGQLLRQRGEADRADADEDRAVALDPNYDAVVK